MFKIGRSAAKLYELSINHPTYFFIKDVIILKSKPIYINNEKTKYIIYSNGDVENTKTGKILKSYINNAGRKCVTICHNNKLYGKTVARWLALSFLTIPNGGDPKDFEADHIDGDPEHDVLENIQWLTSKENNKKRNNEDGKSNIGTHNGMCKLTDDIIVRLIIEDILNGLTTSEISEKHNVPKPTITSIRTGYAWKHITKDYDMSKFTRHCSKYSDELKYQIFDIVKNNRTVSNRDVCKMVGIEPIEKHISLIKNIKDGKYKKLI